MKHKETFAQELCDILVKHKAISPSESKSMHRVFKESGKDQFADFLLEESLVEEEALLKALAEYYEVPAIDVVGYFFDHLLLQNFPKSFLLENRIIPLEIDTNILIVVAANPEDPDLLAGIAKYSPNDVQFRVGLTRDITDAVEEYYDKSITPMMNDDYSDEEEHDEEAAYDELKKEEEGTFPYEEEE